MRWDDVETSSEYKEATPEEQLNVRLGYFRDFVAKTEEWKNTPQEEKSAYVKNFLHGGGKSLADVPASTWENAKKALGRSFGLVTESAISAATLGIAKPELVKDKGELTLADKASQFTGEVVGSILPLGASLKVAKSILSPLATAAIPALNISVAEQGLTGMLYAYAKGRVAGAKDEDIVQDMYGTGLTFGVLAGAIGKVGMKLEERGRRQAELKVKKILEEEGLSLEEIEVVLMEAAGIKVGQKALPPSSPPYKVGPSTEGMKQPFLPKMGKLKQTKLPKEVVQEEKEAAADEVLSLFPEWKVGTEAPLGLGQTAKKAGVLHPEIKAKPSEIPLVDKIKAASDTPPFMRTALDEEDKILLQDRIPEERMSERVKAILDKTPQARTKEELMTLSEWDYFNGHETKAKVISLYSGIPYEPIRDALRKASLKIGIRRRGEVSFPEWASLYGRKTGGIVDERVHTFNQFLVAKGLDPKNPPKWGSPERDKLEGLYEEFLSAKNNYANFKDLGFGLNAIKGVLSPSYMAKVHPSAQALSTSGLSAYVDKKKFVKEFIHRKSEILKPLKKDEVDSLTRLLIQGDIEEWASLNNAPKEVFSSLSPNVIKAYSQIRSLFDDAWGRILQQEPQLAKLTKTGYFPRMFEFFEGRMGVTRAQALGRMAEEHGLDVVKLEGILDKNLPKRSAWDRTLRRTGTDPTKYSRITDLDFVIDSYIYGAANRWSYNKFRYGTELEPGFEKLLKDIEYLPNIHGKMVDYIKTWQGIPPSNWMVSAPIRKAAKALGWFEFTSKLGLNGATAILQLTQYPLFNSAKAVGLAIKNKDPKALGDFMVGFYKPFTQRGRELYKGSMIGADVGKMELGVDELHGFMDKSARVMGYAFLGADQYVKAAAFSQFSRTLAREAAKKGLSGEAAEVYIKRRTLELVGETQFMMGMEDKATLLAHPLGASILRFKSYAIKAAETLSNFTVPELLTFIGMLELIGGPSSVPFLRQWKKELDEKYPDSDAAKVLNKMEEWSAVGLVGKATGQVPDLYYALSDSIFWFSPRSQHPLKDWETTWKERLVDFSLGVTGRDVRVVGDAVLDMYRQKQAGTLDMEDLDWKEMLAGDVGSIITQPHRIARWSKEIEQRYIEMDRKLQGPKLTETEIMFRLAGFTSTSLEKKREWVRNYMLGKKEAADVRALIIDEFLNTTELGDISKEEAEAKFKGLEKDIEEFNTYYWEQPELRIDGPAIRRAMQNRYKTWEERKVPNPYLRQKLEGLR